MNRTFARIATAVAVAAAAAGVIAINAQSAAATTPPYEPVSISFGTLTFYNSSGNVITSGSTTAAPMAAYVVGSNAGRAGDHTTLLLDAQPNPNAAAGAWNKDSLSGATDYPLSATGNPANIVTLSQTHPVSKGAATDLSINDFIGEFPNSDPTGPGCAYSGTAAGCTNAAYQNLYQLRLLTANGADQNPQVEVADVLVSGTTWTQVYPTPVAGPTTTTTSLGASPASPQQFGTNVTLTATVSPTAAGTVQFKDGATNLGSAVSVDGTGHATFSSTTFAAGSHSFTAVFTPTDATAFTPSTSTALGYTITSAAQTMTTTLGITPSSPITVGTPSTMTATVAPTAAGTVQFKDGATNIGAAVAVDGSGHAVKTNSFALNSHNVTAVFTPTDPTAFTGSTSNTVVYVVNPQPATPTTTTLGIAPSSPQPFGTSLTLTGTVSPNNAAGSIQFLDGATVIGSGTVNTSTGIATASNTTLGAGAHSITAQFVPSDSTAFGTSTSSASAYTISQAATTTSLGVGPASPQVFGTQVTLTATVTPSTVPGAVQFFDGASPLGSPVAVASAQAVLHTTTLSVGAHSLTATFQPSSANYAASSTASPTSYTISKPPPTTSTTTLAVTPAGPVVQGTVETLKATITPSSATGTVQFMDGATNIGSPVSVSGGIAQTTTTLPVGTHSLTAAFSSSDATTWTDSNSGTAQSYVVKPPAASTTTALDASPASPQPFGTSVTLHATVTSATEGSIAGSVEFFDGSTSLGVQPLASGAASITTIGLHGGTHSLTAVFTSSAPLDFAGSTSSAVPYTISKLDTTTSLAVTPGPVEQGSSVTLTATVTPSGVPGTVTFKNGTTTLGSAPVSSGTATLHTSSLPVGTASITASFAPTASADYNGSTSNPVTLEVAAPPVFDSVKSNGKTIQDGATLKGGQSLTITGSGFQPGESVAVDVHSTTTKLATVQATAVGGVLATVSLPKALGAGSHTLTLVGSLGTATFHFTIAGSTPVTTPPSSGSSGTGALADTGSNVVGGLLLGSALAGAGALALFASQRRHRGLHRAG